MTSSMERVRGWYDFFIVGYVVMPEHVHLLISEPKRLGGPPFRVFCFAEGGGFRFARGKFIGD